MVTVRDFEVSPNLEQLLTLTDVEHVRIEWQEIRDGKKETHSKILCPGSFLIGRYSGKMRTSPGHLYIDCRLNEAIAAAIERCVLGQHVVLPPTRANTQIKPASLHRKVIKALEQKELVKTGGQGKPAAWSATKPEILAYYAAVKLPTREDKNTLEKQK
jgi:hypothetical protein